MGLGGVRGGNGGPDISFSVTFSSKSRPLDTKMSTPVFVMSECNLTRTKLNYD